MRDRPEERGPPCSPPSTRSQAAAIRTPDQRVRVFVSSTLQELADKRGAVRDAVKALRLVPVMFELGARPHPPRQVYRAYLAQSQVFVGIYWQNYGWVAPGEEVSGLEDEYRLSAGMPRLIYVKSPAPGREPRLAEMLAGPWLRTGHSRRLPICRSRACSMRISATLAGVPVMSSGLVSTARLRGR